jgi:mRNA-degrading endonuclease YafQ of YafQ-DinJ toxin-antitoxin module
MPVDIDLSPGFTRHFKQRANRRIQRLYRERLILFRKNPHDPVLRTHALTHDLDGLWSFSLTDDQGPDDYRVLFRKDKDVSVFVDFGTHNQLYRPWQPAAQRK